MSKTLWHTITIKVPEEMVEFTKIGKVSVKKTLTKTMNISKSQKVPSIKLIPARITQPEIVNEGKQWDVNELRQRMKKSQALAKKNIGRNRLTKANTEQNIKSKVIGASWDIGATQLRNNYIPNIHFIKTLKLNGKLFWTPEMNAKYKTLNLNEKSAFLRRALLDYGEMQYNNQYWSYI